MFRSSVGCLLVNKLNATDLLNRGTKTVEAANLILYLKRTLAFLVFASLNLCSHYLWNMMISFSKHTYQETKDK